MEWHRVPGNRVIDRIAGDKGIVIAPPAGESVQFGRQWVQWDSGASEQVELFRLMLLSQSDRASGRRHYRVTGSMMVMENALKSSSARP
jgi:hypothetical protein